ncbi:MAG: hypothetical protein ACPG19_04900 [Saprospiraceae bacterium]
MNFKIKESIKILFILLLSIPSVCYGQWFMDEAEIEAVNISSDEFINEKGNITNKQFSVKSRVISDELVEKSFFDKKKMLVGKRYYDQYGDLYYDNYGVAIYEYKYDEIGNRVEVKYFNENKIPFQINFIGPATINYNYDKKNRIIRISYFNASGDLSGSMGSAVIEYKYDEKNRIIAETRLNDEEEPIDFFAPLIKYQYDEDNRVIEKSYHTAEGQLASRMLDDEDDPTAIIKLDYLGGQVVAAFYDKNNQLLKG